ncbi:phosphoribosyltransferase family protein [Halorubrum lipolyticum]|uniref:Phosphoribosyl transferase n=1 Tax=Halorubrum lipolyticum DSM 21995 TaxID=1227482 RepID=M0P4F1_9EURY|nr:phosphoribosyltransferase family protein [Halorubrum lipolyticum]EMA64688.1 phosphoribosyl transferase [Halorubrum lipolyticum DSM 21995]
MNYKSVEDLNADARRLAASLPRDIDLVAGIPRSGLLAANLLCLHLDVPMVDIDGLCEGRLFDTGSRFDRRDSLDEFDSVLVVDDSVLTGGQMTETRDRLAQRDLPFDITYGAVYISPEGHRHVDYWGEVVRTPRIFEWNILHHTRLSDFCVDIDGVLCRDPTPAENDDGDDYREFLTTVEPNFVPKQRIGCLVTSRLERYRPETERWLAENGFRYDRLVMMDVPDMETRRKLGNYGQYKADVYESTDADLFIESDPKQAAEIRRRTNRPVFCYETNEMLNPGIVGRSQRRVTEGASAIRAEPVMGPARAAYQFSRRCYHRLLRSKRARNR